MNILALLFFGKRTEDAVEYLDNLQDKADFELRDRFVDVPIHKLKDKGKESVWTDNIPYQVTMNKGTRN
jgi:hypothetical protein